MITYGRQELSTIVRHWSWFTIEFAQAFIMSITRVDDAEQKILLEIYKQIFGILIEYDLLLLVGELKRSAGIRADGVINYARFSLHFHL